MTTITLAQAELLGRAAAEPDGMIYGDDDAKLAKALIKQGLAIWLPVEGGGNRLICTEAGQAALAPAGDSAAATTTKTAGSQNCQHQAASTLWGEPPVVAGAEIGTDVPAEQTPVASKREPTGKLAIVIALLRRPEGASVEEMMEATGWQAHSVRGAMSGALRKKLGLIIESEKAAAGRVYRIASDAEG